MLDSNKNMLAAITVFLARVNGCSSFTHVKFFVRHKATSSAILAQRTILKSSINADNSSCSTMHFDFPTLKSIESELKSALEVARDVDKKYGLCTSPSQQAWSVVDTLYAKMQMFQCSDVDEASSKNEMEEKNGDVKEQQYFF
ncbi:hypothetical protein HJC23_012467 [Cyclotella cryptica]|uniref:Uncharacterized protein n=1 Tax=Cyclotella cryptica TaxID=29204 RepID=A0ABD3PAP7_9STRA|eukprot:CCRYP_016281-RA/>CCRYP_016281-RA protein AED:0.03 eAED:0.03 QI:469/1/1/1/0.5/0.33/3/2753/142